MTGTDSATPRTDTSDRPSRGRKHFVLDTNVLLHNPKSIFMFDDNEVVIPLSVIEELDHFKKNTDDTGRNARQIIRQIDRLRKEGHLFEGVPINDRGGTLRIDSSPGVGTTVLLALPTAPLEEEQVSAPVEPAGSGGRILMVDDDPGLRGVLVRTLEEAGYNVAEASSAEEAAAILADGSVFHLLITDGVPKQKGSGALLERFLVSCPQARVLIYSGHSSEYLLGRGVRRSMRISMAQKPLPSQEFLRVVSEMVPRGRVS